MPQISEIGLAPAGTCGDRDPKWNKRGVTPRSAMYRRNTFLLLAAVIACWTIAFVLTLAGHHWLYAALLLSWWLSTNHFRGYIIVCHLRDVALVAIGIALGLWQLAVLGIVVPFVLTWVMVAALGEQMGNRSTVPFWKIDYPERPQEERRVERYQRLLANWQRRIAAAPTDAAKLERVLFEMRDWHMTPSQAVESACRAGAERELAQAIVETVILWPNLDKPKRIEESDRWSVAIGHPTGQA